MFRNRIGILFLAVLALFLGSTGMVRGESGAKDDDDDDAPVHSRPQRLRQLVQEFMLAETVYPQEKGETQITLATGFRGRSGLSGTRVQMEYGITDRFQVGMSAPWMLGSRRWSLGDFRF